MGRQGGLTRAWARIAYALTVGPRRLGRRGTMLLTLGTAYVIYGAGLILSTTAPPDNPPLWWPADLGELSGTSISYWGVVWIVVGVFLTTGALPGRIDWPQYGAGITLGIWWTWEALTFAYENGSPGTWGPGALYAALSLGLLLIAGWEEPRPVSRRRR